MKAYRINDFETGPRLEDIPRPTPSAGEIEVDIAACGLNFADLLMIRGTYQEKPPLPLTLGLELAGTVIGTGPGVAGFAPGDRVAVYSGQGGLAEYGTFPADRALKLPDAMPFTDAAGFLVAYGTSHMALALRAALQPGETLLVLGAAGGVGLTAVEIGKRMGARVIACARGAEKLAIARAAGADAVIDSTEGDLHDRVKAMGGADVVYDPVGGDLFTQAMRATKPGGRILVVGFASGTVPPIAANHLLVKNISVLGFYLGGYLRIDPGLLTGSFETLFGWYSEGGLKPHISHVLPLDRADEGLELLRSRRSTGKVVITP